MVNLKGAIDSASTDTRALSAQLRSSLGDMANGRTIEVQLDGEPFYGSDPLTISPDASLDWFPGTSPAYYTSNGEVHAMGGDGGPGNAVHGPAGQHNGYSDLAIAKEGSRVAGRLTGDGIYVADVALNAQWQRAIQGADLTAPSWHRDGSLWTYDRKAGAVLRRDLETPGLPTRVAAPDLDERDVTDLRVARDGVRVAVGIGVHEVRVGAITGGARR